LGTHDHGCFLCQARFPEACSSRQDEELARSTGCAVNRGDDPVHLIFPPDQDPRRKRSQEFADGESLAPLNLTVETPPRRRSAGNEVNVAGGHEDDLDHADGLGKAFELHRAALDVGELIRFAAQMSQSLAGEHLARPCQAAEAGCQVERPSPEAAADRNRLTRIQSNPAGSARSGFASEWRA
jgi:hypothetical protein